MAYDEYLADRIERVLHERRVPFFGKKMFGGICFMVNDKMCAGVLKKDLMVRIDPDLNEQELGKPGASPMDFTGQSMKGFILIEPAHTDLDEELEYWLELALDFNPRAKSSRSKS